MGGCKCCRRIERGFGIATFNYADVDPDVPARSQHGVRQQYLAEGQSEPAADEWGTIAAWAWGISRVVDYFETDDKSTPSGSRSPASRGSARP